MRFVSFASIFECMQLKNTTVVFTNELLARLDRYVAREAERMPGYRMKRSAVVRTALAEWLDAAERSGAQPQIEAA
jgi:hypothetical protein